MWPKKRFFSVPPLSEAVTLADEIRFSVFNDGARKNGYCDLVEICRQGGFFPERHDGGFGETSHDALLVPRLDGSFKILVDPLPKSELSTSKDIARHRNRFRIAHEIGHSFFYDRNKNPPRRLTQSSVGEEAFCDEFASALLVPRTAVLGIQPAASSVFLLQHDYDVSAEVAARALAKAYPTVSVVGMMWLPNPNTGVYGMRVVWADGPRFIPQIARLHSSAINRATTGGEAEGVEQLSVGELRGRFSISAARPKGRKQMIAVLTPAADDAAYQQNSGGHMDGVLPFEEGEPSDSKQTKNARTATLQS